MGSKLKKCILCLLQWLVDSFLKYLQDWEDSVRCRDKSAEDEDSISLEYSEKDLKEGSNSSQYSEKDLKEDSEHSICADSRAQGLVCRKKKKVRRKKSIKKGYSQSEIQKMLLSVQTREGLEITGKNCRVLSEHFLW